MLTFHSSLCQPCELLQEIIVQAMFSLSTDYNHALTAHLGFLSFARGMPYSNVSLISAVGFLWNCHFQLAAFEQCLQILLTEIITTNKMTEFLHFLSASRNGAPGQKILPRDLSCIMP